MALTLLAACSSDKALDDVTEVTDSTDPLTFTCLTESNEQENTTRANAQLLTTDFMVSTYKLYKQTNQQTVMQDYHVEYKTTGTAWDGNVRPYWDYTKVSGQYERFWDYSGFPYRFHAISPQPANKTGFIVNDTQLTIPAAYSMQTSLNGMVTPSAAEPYLVAQVQRGTDGKDTDLLSTKDDKTINSTSVTKSRYVALPFHHLNSKIRFGVYCPSPWTSENQLYIEDFHVNVASNNFATSATGYTATATANDYTWYIGTGNSGFTGVTYETSAGLQLLEFDGGADVEGNDMRDHQGRNSAFWLQCQNGIIQIPQEQVKMNVSFILRTADGTIYKQFVDVPVVLENGTDIYDWKSGYIYTYYLIVGGVDDKLPITFTATLTPWEDVSGSLITDLEK